MGRWDGLGACSVSFHRHDAIVVTSWNRRGLDASREFAKALSLSPTPVVATGDHYSFLIPPDGSKENWFESNEADKKREEWKTMVRSRLGDAAEGWVYWVHVRFPGIGDNVFTAEVVESGDER